MKKGFAAYALMVVLISLMAVSLGYSFSYSVSRDWGTSTTTWPNPRQIYSAGYNPNAGAKFYLNDGANIRIADANTGALQKTGAGFPTPSSYDRLTSYSWEAVSGFYFANGVADDGKLYATSLNAPKEILYQWANDTAVPTSQTVAGMGFCRNLNPRGAGTSTVIYASKGGQDFDEGQILKTADGLNFYVAEVVGTASVWNTAGTSIVTWNNPFGKSDCGVKDANTIWGVQPWGYASDHPTSGDPDRWDKIGGNWIRSAAYSPPLLPGVTSSYSPGGDWIKVATSDPRYGAGGGLFVYFVYAPTAEECLMVTNDTTGRQEAARWYFKNDEYARNTNVYGTIRNDGVNQKIYLAFRSSVNSSRGGYERFSLGYIGTGVSDWELY
jgi:hypothetical protein